MERQPYYFNRRARQIVFWGTTSYIRMYDIYRDSWRTLSSLYPLQMSTGHAEVSPADSTIVVVGGIGNGIISKIFRGRVLAPPNDTIITWDSLAITDTLWGNPIYRVAGAKWKQYMIFGPAMKDSATSAKIYGIGTGSDTVFAAFLPGVINLRRKYFNYCCKRRTRNRFQLLLYVRRVSLRPCTSGCYFLFFYRTASDWDTWKYHISAGKI